MITAADYVDWSDAAGLYLGNASEADRYRTIEPKISRAGFVARVVHDFLRDSDGGIDLQRWRSMDIPEIGADAAFRIEETARALEEIGAPRVAAKMRTVQDISPHGLIMQNLENLKSMEDLRNLINPADLLAQMRGTLARHFPDMAAQAGLPIPERESVPLDADIEPFEQVEMLLTKYVQAHQSELQADIHKYGDVRQRPGYDPEVRQRELAALRESERDQEQQREDLATMQKLIAQIESLLVNRPKPKPPEVADARREFLKCYHRHHRRAAAELIPELRAWLPQAAAFLKEHDALFRPQPTTDKALLKRLADLGEYHLDTDQYFTSITWEEPKGFDCDWCSFSLRLAYPPKQPEKLPMLLDACQRLRRRFAKAQEQLRADVLERFAAYNSHGFDDDEYELDERGNPTEESILKTADGGSISFNAYDGADGFEISVLFDVDWDPEHGAETCLQDEPEEEPAAAPPRNVEFGDSGPKLTPEDLNAFERQHTLKLPGGYREFLLMHNGGRPMPNHLKHQVQGAPLAIDVERFYALKVGGDGDLATVLLRHRAQDLPKHYLPIGRMLFPGLMGGQGSTDLVLGLSGKHEGKVLAVMHPYASMPGAATPQMQAQAAAMMSAMYEQMCTPIAPNVSTLLSCLTTRPTTKAPDWLDAIRRDDANRFAQWLKQGGKLTEQHTEYGAVVIRTARDYLASEASPALLQELLAQSLIKPAALLSGWESMGRDLARFKQLRPLLPRTDWRFALASGQAYDDTELLNELLAAGVDLNAPVADEGAPPLHCAVRAGHAGGVRWLLKNGAAVRQKDQYDRTALIWAESERQLECLKLLIEAGESLESLFPHMRTMKDKLRLIQSRWMDQYPALAAYLHSRGIDA